MSDPRDSPDPEGEGLDPAGEGGQHQSRWGYDDTMGSEEAFSEEEEEEEESTPFGANEENLALDREVKRGNRELLELEASVEQNESRVKVMTDHLKNVQQELEHTQALLSMRQKEAESEAHLASSVQKEAARAAKDKARMEAEARELREKMNTNQNNIFTTKEKLEAVKGEMEWDEKEMQAWLEQQKLVDEDADMMQKYAKIDEGKIKELVLLTEKLTLERDRAHADLAQTALDVRTRQIGLDKISDEYRRVHAEQREFSDMWEGVLRQMEQRDEEIYAEAERFQSLMHERSVKHAKVVDQEDFIKTERENNQEVEKEVAMVERRALRQRAELLRAEEQLQSFREEVAALRSTMGKVGGDLNAKKAEVRQLEQQEATYSARVARLEKELAETKAKLADAQKRQLSAAERTNALEAMLEEETLEERQLQAALSQVRQTQFQQQTRLRKIQEEEGVIAKEIESYGAASRNVRSRGVALEKEIASQQRVMYQQDFEMMALERKLAAVSGVQSLEDKTRHDAEVKDLKERIGEQKKVRAVIDRQLSKVEAEQRVAKQRLDKVRVDRVRWAERYHDLEMAIAGGEKELRDCVDAKQQLMVEENLLKLELRRVRQLLNSRADSVLTLEQRKVQLKAAIDERLQDIRIHKEMLEAQIKDLSRDRAAVARELGDRLQRAEKLRKRYEIIMSTMAPSEDGEPRTQAYFVIKAAQEREQLQQKGDELDAKIRKGSKEIRALENTLKMMEGRNMKFKESKRRPATGDDHVQEKQRLEEKYRTAMDKYKHKRREVRDLHEELSAMQATLEDLSLQDNDLRRVVEQAEANLDGIDRDLAEQSAKLTRASKQAEKMIAQHRQTAGAESLAELDFAYKQARLFNQKILSQIDGIVSTNSDLEAEVSMLFSRANIKRTAGGRRIPGGSSVSSRSTAASSRSRAGRGPARAPKTAAEAAAQHQKQQGGGVSKTTLELGDFQPPRSSQGRRPGSTSSTRSSKSRSGNRLG